MKNLYTEVTPDNFFKNDDEFTAALGKAYIQLGGYASGDVNNLQETTTDEMVVPTRGLTGMTAVTGEGFICIRGNLKMVQPAEHGIFVSME